MPVLVEISDQTNLRLLSSAPPESYKYSATVRTTFHKSTSAAPSTAVFITGVSKNTTEHYTTIFVVFFLRHTLV